MALDVRQISKLIDRYRLDLSYYEGYVVNNDDPNHCSRVKVRVQALTSKEGQMELPVEDLPWYPTLQGFGEGGNSGTNIPPIDARVIVIFPTDDIYNGLVISQVTSIAPNGNTKDGVSYSQPNSNYNDGSSITHRDTYNSDQTASGDSVAETQARDNLSDKTSASDGTISNPTTVPGSQGATSVTQPSAMKRVYTNADGTTTTKEGGTRAWRNNNEGNLRYTEYSKSKGAIGQDKDGFAIFPDEATGRKAKEDLIFSSKSYKDLTLENAIHRYAPPNENNTALYQKRVLASVGGVNKPMNEYTPSERAAILESMRKMEGYKAGTVT